MTMAAGLALSLVATLAFTGSGQAFGTGAGYGPPQAPTSSGAAPGSGTVVITCTIPTTGGTCTATIGGYTVTVTVPANTFSFPVQVVITDRRASEVSPGGCGQALVAFGISVFNNGTAVNNFPALPVALTGSAIQSGDGLYSQNGSSLTAYQGSVTNGSATFSISNGTDIELATSTSCAPTAATNVSAVPGATQVVTGKPFLLEGGVAAGLVVGGGVLVFGSRRRRRTT
jgi:hypothetical protein